MGLGELPLTISANSELGIFRNIVMEERRLVLPEWVTRGEADADRWPLLPPPCL